MYTNLRQWKRVRRRILVRGEAKRAVAKDEHISRNTLRRMLEYETPPGYGGRRFMAETALSPERPCSIRSSPTKQRWTEWLYALDRGTSSGNPELTSWLSRPSDPRKKILSVLAQEAGFSSNAISRHLGIARATARKYIAAFNRGGTELLLGHKKKPRKADKPDFKHALFGLLHEPPTLSGFSRTSWRMQDLQKALGEKGHPACKSVIREAIKNAGFRWKSAKVVLTSNDPEYREKLGNVQHILRNLKGDERFFSIDEFGPFAIKKKAGRKLVDPDDSPSVPQWQKSKGWLIATAALELSTNQVTHFYSKAKNTAEMIRMAERLLLGYRNVRKIYLSWDAASWHVSKELLAFIDEHNRACVLPAIEVAPLPASAQFLNVIESVFSGMARAIIHNSDYPSVEAAKEAIDRYFEERNRHFLEKPQRAGNRIWGAERSEAVFDLANNCKDPAYR